MSANRTIQISASDIIELTTSVNRIIGQLQNISLVISENKITDQTFTQLLAVKGGASKICKEIISRGVLKHIDQYSMEELDQALNIIFKLD
jgi:DNA-binding FrmR family transcriptional regulator